MGSQALAQGPARIVKSPVPIWNEVAPPEKPGAFFDPSQNQVVLAIPTPGNANLRWLRYDIPNGANAAVEFSVQASSAGSIQYTYSLNDDPRAPQRSKRFRMLLPAHDSSLVTSSNVWQFETESTTLPDRTATVRAGTMRFASWRDPASGEAKVSGLRLALESTYLPGFVDSFIEGQVKNPLTPEVVSNLPADIRQQAQQFLEPGIGNTPQFLIGPLFRPDTRKTVIAANYHFGISLLQRAGRIRPDSPYAKQLLDSLSTFLTAGYTPAPTMPSTAPSSPLEQVIHQALLLCFR